MSDHWPLRATKVATGILKIQTSKLFFQKWYFYNPGIIVILNSNIRHTYLNIKINNQGNTLHVWSLTTESNKGSHQYTDNSNF